MEQLKKVKVFDATAQVAALIPVLLWPTGILYSSSSMLSILGEKKKKNNLFCHRWREVDKERWAHLCKIQDICGLQSV